MSNPPPTILFVHGSWHQPSHFAPVRKLFAAHGLETECPQQPSYGDITLPDPLAADAKTIHDAVAALVEKGLDVIVVMHSYGGIVGSQAVTADLGKKARAEKGEKGGVVHLVYLCAFVVPLGLSLGGAFGGDLPPFIPIKEDGSCTMDNPDHRFYNDLPKPEQDKWVAELRPQLAKAQLTPISNAAYQHYPVTYLFCENDQALPVEVQRMMVESNGPHFDTETCTSGHSPFLSMPERVLEVVQKVVQKVVGQTVA